MTKQQQKKSRIGKKLAKQLIATSDLLMDYYAACCEAGDPVQEDGLDTRKMLSAECSTYGKLMRDIHGE
ncbi:hypothetical protein [Polynucleobacter sp.]|uniref:hypothetical protein n=1 Tax=Polynucleobacter sp. TaxID=2029855 RepID=UPI003F6A4394